VYSQYGQATEKLSDIPTGATYPFGTNPLQSRNRTCVAEADRYRLQRKHEMALPRGTPWAFSSRPFGLFVL